MTKLNLDEISNGDITAKLTNRVKKTLNEDTLYNFLNTNGLIPETTEMKMIFVKEKIDKAISEGKILKGQIDLCYNNSYSSVFTIK